MNDIEANNRRLKELALECDRLAARSGRRLRRQCVLTCGYSLFFSVLSFVTGDWLAVVFAALFVMLAAAILVSERILWKKDIQLRHECLSAVIEE